MYWCLNFCTMGAGECVGMGDCSLHCLHFFYRELEMANSGIVGLPMESLFTLIGLKWAGYFLSFCKDSPPLLLSRLHALSTENFKHLIGGFCIGIIVNVSPAFTSYDTMPSFFQYGYAFPFYHSVSPPPYLLHFCLILKILHTLFIFPFHFLSRALLLTHSPPSDSSSTHHNLQHQIPPGSELRRFDHLDGRRFTGYICHDCI